MFFFLNQTYLYLSLCCSRVCAGTTEEYCCRRYQRTCGRRWGTSQPSSRSNPRTTKSGKKHNKCVWRYFTTPWTCITRLKASKVFSCLTDRHLPNTNAFRPRVFLTHWGRHVVETTQDFWRGHLSVAGCSEFFGVNCLNSAPLYCIFYFIWECVLECIF